MVLFFISNLPPNVKEIQPTVNIEYRDRDGVKFQRDEEQFKVVLVDNIIRLVLGCWVGS